MSPASGSVSEHTLLRSAMRRLQLLHIAPILLVVLMAGSVLAMSVEEGDVLGLMDELVASPQLLRIKRDGDRGVT
jgi:hypothetical protein